jgi:hypothetical protein
MNMKKESWVFAGFIGLFFTGCQKDLVEPKNNEEITVASSKQSDFVNTFYGPEVHLGDGKVRSFIIITHEDVPQEIGIEITEGLFQNLPIVYTDMHIPVHHKATEVTAYDHIEMDWMPNGHPPAYFQLPHFDLHFYMLTEEEQMMIPAPTATNTLLTSTAAYGRPSPGVLPVDYTVASAAVPMMGRHWLDKFADVLSGASFTHQLIYGTFDNEVVFLEPMVTRAFLLSGTEVHKAIKQPTTFDPTGTYYPTRYNIYRDENTGKTFVTLDQFVLR